MKQQNRNTGRRGEDLAAKYLTEKGYQILERNFANRFGEIDIIAKDKDTTVFVEVKTKLGDNLGLPEEMINKGKLNKIRNMASIFLKGESRLCRIDVVAVVWGMKGEVSRLTHYENVY